MAPLSHSLPKLIDRDDLSIITDTNSTVSTPGGQPGPGRIIGGLFARFGERLEDLLALAALRLGFGLEARMSRLALSLISPQDRQQRERGWGRLSLGDLTMQYIHATHVVPRITEDKTDKGAALAKLCQKLTRSIR